jgi:phospholipid/cholesterol/gamma-HCH transport system substrate-binding protein
MPHRKDIRWAELRVGAMVAASLIIFAVAIFLISGQIGFLTRKYTLKAYFPTAGGLRQGSQVSLAGIPVGEVSHIKISPYSDPQRAVEVDLRVARKFENQIRADSQADINTQGVLGEAYLDISRGSPDQPQVPPDGVLKSHQEKDIRQIVQNADDVVSNLRVLSSKLNDITDQVTAGKGSIGKLLYDETLYDQLQTTAKSAAEIVEQVKNGQGTIGKFVTDDTVYQRSVATLDRLNNLIDQIEHGQGTVGKLVSDPALYNQMKDLVAKGNALVDKVNSGQGTLGKLVTDDQLYNRVNSTAGHLDTVTARMDQGQGTLGKLSTDPTLYNNLSTSSQSLKEFLDEFRKNPKKYLTLHLHIF